MELKQKILKQWMKKTIIDIFEKEVEMYAKHLDIPKERILSHISRFLVGEALLDDEAGKVIRVFRDRVKFYSTISPLSEDTIKEVVEEHMELLTPRKYHRGLP